MSIFINIIYKCNHNYSVTTISDVNQKTVFVLLDGTEAPS